MKKQANSSPPAAVIDSTALSAATVSLAAAVVPYSSARPCATRPALIPTSKSADRRAFVPVSALHPPRGSPILPGATLNKIVAIQRFLYAWLWLARQMALHRPSCTRFCGTNCNLAQFRPTWTRKRSGRHQRSTLNLCSRLCSFSLFSDVCRALLLVMASAPAQHHAFHHLLQLSITRRACRDRRMLLKLLKLLNLRKLLLRTLLRQLPEQLLQHLLNL